MDRIRRPGGELVPVTSLASRKVLLPTEVQLINSLGITEEDYWYFLALAEKHYERSDDYALVPDVRNGPVTMFIVNLVVGIALSAASALLAPKPRTDKPKQPIKTADKMGTSRFAVAGQFDSLQELANLGDVVPLVFSRQGVRVNAQLVWSQLLSIGNGQQLRAMSVLSAGDLGDKPSYYGYALGDMLLKDYSEGKIALYFNSNGGRFQERYAQATDRYIEGTAVNTPHSDPFAIWWDKTRHYEPLMVAARNPSAQIQFGAYAPMPNGNRYKVPYELVMTLRGSDGETYKMNSEKKKKIREHFPRHAHIFWVSPGLPKGGTIGYKLGNGKPDNSDFKPWGTSDVRTALTSARESYDSQIAEGDLYLAGSCLCIATSVPAEPWREGTDKSCVFRIEEAGGMVSYEAENDNNYSVNTYWLQRVSLGTVSNARECAATEIGLKSVVWRQVNGLANVNSEPDPDAIDKYRAEKQQITLGNVTTYTARYSFFRLQVRRLGETSGWFTLGNDDAIFAIKGNNPQAQYNYIRIVHPWVAQWEYRFLPVPGNWMRKNRADQNFYILQGGVGQGYSSVNTYGTWWVAFQGVSMRLTEEVMSNKVWFRWETTYKDSEIAPPTEVVKGMVVSVSANNNGSIPQPNQSWQQTDGPRYSASPKNWVERWVRLDINMERWTFYWDGKLIGGVDTARNPGPCWIDTSYNGQAIRFYAITCTSEPQCSRYELVQYWSIAAYQYKEDPNSIQYKFNVPAVGGSGTGLYFDTKYNPVTGAFAWVMATSPPAQSMNYVNGEQVTVQHTAGSSTPSYRVTVATVDQVPPPPAEPEYEFYPESLRPWDALDDGVVYDVEASSHFQGPEHEIAYVNEIVELPASLPQGPQYPGLAMIGLRINTAKEINSFNQLSAYVKRGIKSYRLITGGYESINTVPDIAFALLTRKDIGAGGSMGPNAVNSDELKVAAAFCEANGYFWDGVLDQRVNIREWLFEQAGYCLLDFVIKGGQFSLQPSVPYTDTYKLDPNGKPSIKALFTDGNTKDMKTTFLDPQARQMFRAAVVYRHDTENGFPEKRTMVVKYIETGVNPDNLPMETFDMSGFCRSRWHAYDFARYALLLRRWVDHSVQFETTPNHCFGLKPGDYIRVRLETTHLNRWRNGSVSPDGIVQCAEQLSGSYSIIYWVPGTTGIQTATLQVSGGRTSQTALFNTIFSIDAPASSESTVYKVETISLAEEGFVSIAASYVPLTESGTLKVLEWFYPDGTTPRFTIEES